MEEPDAMTRTSWFWERPMQLRMGLPDLHCPSLFVAVLKLPVQTAWLKFFSYAHQVAGRIVLQAAVSAL